MLTFIMKIDSKFVTAVVCSLYVFDLLVVLQLLCTKLYCMYICTLSNEYCMHSCALLHFCFLHRLLT